MCMGLFCFVFECHFDSSIIHVHVLTQTLMAARAFKKVGSSEVTSVGSIDKHLWQQGPSRRLARLRLLV